MTSLGRKKTESNNCLANFLRTISQTSSLFHQSQHKRKIRDKNKSIVDKCSDLTCTKKYALTDGPKQGEQVMWATRSAPPSQFMLATGLKDIDSERKKTKLGYFVERVHLSVTFCFILNPEKNIDINNMTLLMNTM